MSLLSLLCALVGGFHSSASEKRWGAAGRQRRSRTRLLLEPLEDRTLLASVGFAVNTGSAGGGTAGTAVAVDQAGNVYTNAVVPPGRPFSGDNILVKYSSSGQLLWSIDPSTSELDLPASGRLYGGGINAMGGIALDAAGNVYVGWQDVGNDAIAKYDGTTGRFLWGDVLGSPYGTPNAPGRSINALALDSAGNIYFTGNFSTAPNTPLTLGYWSRPGGVQQVSPSLFSLQSNFSWGSASGFILELDSAGHFVWGGGLILQDGGPLPGNYYVGANGIAADGAGNVYVAGRFAGSVNFDPNGGLYRVTSSNIGGSSGALPPDTFVLKLNAAHQLVWTDDLRRVGDFGSSFANAITADAVGNVFLTGGHQGGVNFDPGPGIHEIINQNGAFVEKLDTNGRFQWVANAVGYNAQGFAVALDSAGKVYTAGLLFGNTNFGTAVLGGPGQQNGYVWQLDANGNPLWAGSLIGSVNGAGAAYTDGIAVDSAGDIFLAGGAGGDLPLRILPGPGEVDLNTAYYLSPFGLTPVGSLGYVVKLVQNTPPTANAGGPYSINEGDSLTLNASASADPDGDPLTYSWTINGHANAASGVKPTLTWAQLQALGIDDAPATFNVQVRVDDGHGNVVTSPPTTLTLFNATPTASLGAAPPTNPEGTAINLTGSATDPSAADTAAGFAFTWSVTKNGNAFASGTGPAVSFTPDDDGTYVVTFSATDEDRKIGSTTRTILVSNVPPTANVSGPRVGLVGQVLTFNLGATDPSPVDRAAGFTYTVDWGDGTLQNPDVRTIGPTPGNGAGIRLTHSYSQAASYTVQVTATDGDGGISAVASLGQPIESVTSANLQTVLNFTTTVTLQANTSTDADPIVAAVNGLSAQTAPVTIQLNLGSGTFSDVTASPPPGVTLVITGNGTTTTLVGQSPALTVTSGTVMVTGVTFTTSTNAPTILVSGGSLRLRNDTVQESTGAIQAAIAITGGTVDLGTKADAGGNTLNVNGPGEFIHNTGLNAVPVISDTFSIDGVVLDTTQLAADFRIANHIFDGLDAGGGGLVTFVADNVYVTHRSAGIQRAVDAVPAGYTINVQAREHEDVSGDESSNHGQGGCTINVQAGGDEDFGNYTVGTKLLTVKFQNGPTLSLQNDLPDGMTTLRVTGVPGANHIAFHEGKSPASIRVAIDDLPTGTFAPTGRIIAHGGGANAHIEVSDRIRLLAMLFADGANGRLQGGGGPTVEVGGGDHTYLEGGQGRNLLIAGKGAGRLEGNGQDDILIGGYTDFDNNEAALAAIMAEWTKTYDPADALHDYQIRVDHLMGTLAGGRNGTTLLTATTVHDNGVKDHLEGGGGHDLFFAALSGPGKDKLDDLVSGDVVVDLVRGRGVQPAGPPRRPGARGS